MNDTEKTKELIKKGDKMNDTEKTKELILQQEDATQLLVRPMKDNPFSNFSEEIIESKKIGKRIRTVYHYKDELDDNGKLVGKSLQSYDITQEDI
mgnify:CR=1 FL=1